MARFYMLTGKWAGNGLSNEFIKWFDPLIYAGSFFIKLDKISDV